MGSLIELLRKLGPIKISIMVGVLAILAVFFAYITLRISKPPLVALYTDVSPIEASKMTSKLESLHIPYELRSGGSALFVDEENVSKLRMQFAEEGLPSGGNVGYEIFDKGESLGVSSFTQDVNRLRALEGELARSIATIKQVGGARVHLVIPKKSLFTSEHQAPTASVVLKLNHGIRLGKEQIQGILYLVSSAVPGLSTNAISVIDDKGNLLARGDTNENPGVVGFSKMEELRMQYQSKLSGSIESLLEKSLGAGKVRTEVYVELDTEQITESSQTFDPSGQVVRSAHNTEDSSQSKDAGSQATTVQNNLPGGAGGGDSKNSNQSKHNEEVINYDISNVARTRVKEIGGVKKLSVAVLIDGNYSKDDKGVEKYTPRTEEEMKQITSLVKSSMGFDEKRGDKVEVINMQFAREESQIISENNGLILGMTKAELIRLLEVIFLSIGGIMVGFIVLKPIIDNLFVYADPNSAPPPSEAPASVVKEAAPQEAPAEPEEEMVKVENIEGTVKVSTINRLDESLKNNPDKAVEQIKKWMSERENE